MFGFDEDRRDVFEITLEKTIELGIDVVGANILVPYPGTAFFRSLERANRIIHSDYAKYNAQHAVFLPRHMAPGELEDGRDWFNWEFHSFCSILKRTWISKTVPWLTLPINLAKHRIRNRHIPETRKKGKVSSSSNLPTG